MTGRLEGVKSSPLVMPGPLLVSVLGIMFCAWIALGNSMEICVTAGCELNENTSLWGISLWWYGAFAFCVLTILSLSGKPWLGVIAAGICVFLDIWLLLLMLTTSPCVSCLVVGFMFVLAYFAFRHAGRGLDPLPRSILVMVWMVFFIANVGVIVRDSPGTWAMYGSENPTIKVYFSPSCVHCSKAIEALASNKDVAFYPVSEKDGDFDAIANMASFIAAGDNIMTAFNKAQKVQENPLGIFENSYLYFQLLRNKSEVLMSGSNVVPFIEYHGLPAALVPPKPKPPVKAEPKITPVPPKPAISEEPMETLESMDPINQPQSMPNDNSALPIDTGIAGSCGGGEEKPCPDDEPRY